MIGWPDPVIPFSIWFCPRRAIRVSIDGRMRVSTFANSSAVNRISVGITCEQQEEKTHKNSVADLSHSRSNVHFNFVSLSISSPFHSSIFFFAELIAVCRFTSVGITWFISTLLTFFAELQQSNCWRGFCIGPLRDLRGRRCRHLDGKKMKKNPIQLNVKIVQWSPTCKVNIIII